MLLYPNQVTLAVQWPEMLTRVFETGVVPECEEWVTFRSQVSNFRLSSPGSVQQGSTLTNDGRHYKVTWQRMGLLRAMKCQEQKLTNTVVIELYSLVSTSWNDREEGQSFRRSVRSWLSCSLGKGGHVERHSNMMSRRGPLCRSRNAVKPRDLAVSQTSPLASWVFLLVNFQWHDDIPEYGQPAGIANKLIDTNPTTFWFGQSLKIK